MHSAEELRTAEERVIDAAMISRSSGTEGLLESLQDEISSAEPTVRGCLSP